MTSSILKILFFFAPCFSMLRAFNTKITNEGSVIFPSLTLHRNAALGAFCNTNKLEIKAFECLDLSCSDNRIFTITSSDDVKYEEISVGVSSEGTIYTAFFNEVKNSLQLGILFPNRSTIFIRTLNTENGPFSYGPSDMVMLNDKYPLIVFQNGIHNLKYALCSNPPFCTNNRVEILDKGSKVFSNPRARLDSNGYLNICINSAFGIRYIRCYDRYCAEKNITILPSEFSIECKDIDINPLTNFAGFFISRYPTHEFMFFACQDLACKTYNTSLFSFGQSQFMSGAYGKNGIPHILYIDYSTHYLMGIGCPDPLCSSDTATSYVLDKSTRFYFLYRVILDKADKEVLLYTKKETNDLYYFRALETYDAPKIDTQNIKTEEVDFFTYSPSSLDHYVYLGTILFIISSIFLIYFKIKKIKLNLIKS